MAETTQAVEATAPVPEAVKENTEAPTAAVAEEAAKEEPAEAKEEQPAEAKEEEVATEEAPKEEAPPVVADVPVEESPAPEEATAAAPAEE